MAGAGIAGMDRTEWGRGVVSAALRRLARRLPAELRLERCTVSPRGEWWRVTLHGRWAGAGLGAGFGAGLATGVASASPGWAAEPAGAGSGSARWPRSWAPGDPRARRRLELALAEALAALAESTGAGLAIGRGYGGEGRRGTGAADGGRGAAPGAAAAGRFTGRVRRAVAGSGG